MAFYGFAPVGLLLSLLTGLSQSCTDSDRQEPGLEKIAQMPKQVEESSGLALAGQPGEYFTHRDAGGSPVLYRINSEGKLLNSLTIRQAENEDWEDLARDTQGTIYIGDFGNNDNSRKDLVIYKLRNGEPTQVERISFQFENQEEYPPSKKNRDFDCEAFFWHRGKLYLLTKNRGSKAGTNLYEIPDQAGKHQARPLGSLKTEEVITSADISPDGQQLALVSNDNLYLFDVKGREPAAFGEGKRTKLPLRGTGQTEAVVFENPTTLLLSDEEGGLYRYVLERE